MNNMKQNKKYTWLQKFVASMYNEAPEWYYATPLERVVMEYEGLSDDDKTQFFQEINKKVCQCKQEQ